MAAGQQGEIGWDERGLAPAIVQDANTGQVLMLAYMDRTALERTLETGETWFWSRSRGELWHKGATSGLIQKIVELRIDDDQDAVWLRVEVVGDASCHVGYRSCFYRAIPTGEQQGETPIEMEFKEFDKMFDPKEVYGDAPNPTKL